MIITALWLLMFGVHSQSPEVGQRHRYHAMSTPKTIGFMSTRSATQIGTGRDPPTGSMPPTDSSPRDVAWLDSSVFKHDESQRIPRVGGEQHLAADRFGGVGEATLWTGHHDGRVAEPLLVQAGQPMEGVPLGHALGARDGWRDVGLLVLAHDVDATLVASDHAVVRKASTKVSASATVCIRPPMLITWALLC